MSLRVPEAMLSILVDPKTKQPLHPELREACGDCECSRRSCGQQQTVVFTDEQKNTDYPFVDGIVHMLKDGDISGKNMRYQELYDRIAFWYAPLCRLGQWMFGGRHKKGKFFDCTAEFDIQPGQRVLEVSVGSGDKLAQMPEGIEFYGIDISLGMLSQSHKKALSTKFPVLLAQAKAEALPFADNSFDVVFHVGGINFFSDKAAAISEMIRVAKPGALILISDETEELAKKGEKTFFAKQFFVNRDEVIVPPVELVAKHIPRNLIHLEYCYDNTLYFITFKKPL